MLAPRRGEGIRHEDGLSGAPAAPAGEHPARLRPDLATLRARLPAVPRTRFAPAPTGLLHLGHVANAIYVWGLARATGARVLLRIEDHDRQRCQRAYEHALLDDLEWLGFVPDEFPVAAFRRGACPGRQSDRDARYRAAAARLAAAGLLFACDCSRRDIVSAMADATGPGVRELRYAGACRARALPLEDGVGWRLRTDPGDEEFDDALCGAQRQTPAQQCGDVLIRDRLGNWSYQFAVAVDDLEQQATLVIRGLDVLASTGRQIRVARLLGRREPPVFAHHGLLMQSPTQKLSKAEGATGVRALRAAGWTAPQMIGAAAHRLGLQAQPSPVEPGAVAQLST
jgi:glutamyl-tRNA synthetase/glutamyl-Q tRNA(Asp) synthetase